MSCSVRLLLLTLLAWQVHGQCSIRVPEIQNSNGVFTYTDARRNVQLLRSPTVASGITLTIYCMPNELHQTTCQRNGQFQPAFQRCANPLPGPSVRQVVDPSCPATMYAIGHTINNQFLELYRACYNPRSVRAYFSEATLYPKRIFPQRPCQNFDTDGVITPAQAASFLKGRIYSTFRRIYGPNQQYISNNQDLVINRGHLTASADFLFGDQMCGTFKYVNVVPQFRTINDGNWETIERWVRNQIPANSVLRVRTGAVGVLALPDTSPQPRLRLAYLAPGNQNPVPEWMYKLVRDFNNQPLYAFLTYNNIYATQRPPSPAFCQVRQCPMQLINSATEGYTYCCDPARFVPP